jgi:hypothetical protein
VICSFVIIGCASNTNRQVSAYDESLQVSYPLATQSNLAGLGGSNLYGRIAPVMLDNGLQGAYVARQTIRSRQQILAPPTGKQRFSTILGTGLGLGTLALIGLGIAFPSAILLFFVKWFFAIRNALSETVAAIHNSNAIATTPALKDALKNSQTPATREIVTQLKAEA